MRITIEAIGDVVHMEIIAPKDQPTQVHVHHHYPNRGNNRPSQIERATLQEVKRMGLFLERVRATLARNTDVVASGDSLLRTLSQQLRTALENDDTEGAISMLDQIDANSTKLATAVAESTQAAPTQPSEPIADDPNTPWDESKGETGPAQGGEAT